jgi:hypothetical protein
MDCRLLYGLIYTRECLWYQEHIELLFIYVVWEVIYWIQIFFRFISFIDSNMKKTSTHVP